MISCDKATELVEKKSSIGISLIELIQLRFHNLICKGCKIYETQSKLIDNYLKKNSEQSNVISTNELINNISNEKLKEKILNNIK